MEQGSCTGLPACRLPACRCTLHSAAADSQLSNLCTALPPLCLQAVLYCPSEPSDCALKLHSTLQRFAWTEAEVGWHASVPH